MPVIECRMKPYIQPFERQLAIAELTAIAGSPVPIDNADASKALTFQVRTRAEKIELVRTLAYWERVRNGAFDHVTLQALREATVNVVRNGVPVSKVRALVSKNTESALPNRRCLRYGTHGIHEYRGKFFPQLVRSLINISGIKRHGVVADPMCGSGTTAVEALLAGHDTLALDLNPLSVFITNTKCRLLSTKPKVLISAYDQIRERLLEPKLKWSGRDFEFLSSLPTDDQKYLRSWFSDQVLSDLDKIVQCIRDTNTSAAVQDLMRLALSNILRSVSWQNEADLRVRKQVRLDAEIDPVREFLEELGRSVRVVLAFLFQSRLAISPQVSVQIGDARQLDQHWKEVLGRVELIVTSPPYATALPYLDTDRLSLCYLGLLPRPQHRKRDQEMIGNREITEKVRRAYWEHFQDSRGSLPAAVSNLIDRVYKLNANAKVGFRRKNLPSLLAKYFLDMQHVFRGMLRALRPGAKAYVVVGSNHTIAGGQRVEIDTPALLAQLAESCDFRLVDSIKMEMLVSRDIFKKNASESEEILCLQKTG